MSLALAAHPEARDEFLEAVRAVRDLTGLEKTFLEKAAAVGAAITSAPEAFPLDRSSPIGLEVRRARIGRFPWRIVYVVRPAGVYVVAVAHARRESGYWLGRLG